MGLYLDKVSIPNLNKSNAHGAWRSGPPFEEKLYNPQIFNLQLFPEYEKVITIHNTIVLRHWHTIPV